MARGLTAQSAHLARQLSFAGLAAVAALVPSAGCQGSEQTVFEVSSSHGRSYQEPSGYFLTASGELYASSRDDLYWPAQGMIDHAFGQRYDPSRLVGIVPADQMQSRLVLVDAARKDVLVRQDRRCWDCGGTAYLAWVYEAGHYSLVLLGGDGGTPVCNPSPEAQELASWLASLTGHYRSASCAFDADCAQGACSAEAPWCKPATAGSPELNTSHCPQVSDCGACSQWGSCVIDAALRKHCAMVDGAGCAADPEICAAGKSWCHGSRDTGYYCAPP